MTADGGGVGGGGAEGSGAGGVDGADNALDVGRLAALAPGGGGKAATSTPPLRCGVPDGIAWALVSGTVGAGSANTMPERIA
ncbi:MAG: hypothetical protein ACOVVK_06495 [Elsteraceae bacterium]